VADAEVVTRIERLFEDALSMPAPAPDDDLVDGAVLDSLSLVTLLFEIEREFGVQIPLESLDVDDFRTIERLAELAGGDA
jgi:acyl carrier protein